MRLLRHGARAVGAQRAAERCFQTLRHVRETLIVGEGRFSWPRWRRNRDWRDWRRLYRRLRRSGLTVHVLSMGIEILREACERLRMAGTT